MRTSYREIIIKPFIINKTSEKNIVYLRYTPVFKKRRKSRGKEATSYELRYDGRLSKKGRRVDALALRAEEGRDKLRKAAVRSKYPVTRRYPNGETRLRKPQSSYGKYIAI